MSNIFVLEAKGLNTSPNELNREAGSLVEATNVTIRRDGVIEPVRGFGIWGNTLPISNQRVNQIISYRGRIFRQFATSMSYDNTGNGDFVVCADSFRETESGLRTKSIEANGNLYTTSYDGIKKISAKTTSDFTTEAGFISQAGGVKAADFSLALKVSNGDTTSFLTGDSSVAYRVVWGLKDKNSNLVLGTPSQREVITNSRQLLVINDFLLLLNTLDRLNSGSGSQMIRDANYVSLLKVAASDSAVTLGTNLVALSQKLDNDIFLASQPGTEPLTIASAAISSGICTITFSAGTASSYLSVGKNISISGFTPATGTLNGVHAVTATSPTTISFTTTATGAVTLSTAQIHYAEYQSITTPAIPSLNPTAADILSLQTYLQSIITKLQNEPLTIISSTDSTQLASIILTESAKVQLTITIPEEVTINHFLQVYRSSLATATGVTTLDIISPDDELQLVYESYPSTSELATHSMILEDVTPDEFRGAFLYTNASTGEGILQANELPPFAKDINRFKNSIFYANTRTRHRLTPSLLGVTKLISDYGLGTIPSITTADSSIHHTYDFVSGLKQSTVITCTAGTSLSGKYFLIDTSNSQFYVWFNTGSSTDPNITGRTGLEILISSGDSASTVATKLYNNLSTKIYDFYSVSIATSTVTVVDTNYKEIPVATVGNSGFTINITLGRGEKIARNSILLTCPAASNFVTSGTADYFTLSSTGDLTKYYVWFQVGTATSPALSGYIGLVVVLTGAETAAQVVAAINAIIPTSNFLATPSTTQLTITNKRYGKCTAATEVVSTGLFTLSTVTTGALNVLLSPEVSPAKAVDETSRSLVRIINKNEDDIISAYYISSATDVPGKMLFENRSVSDTPFYITANNANTGISFNPDISPSTSIISTTAGVKTLITTSLAHGLTNTDKVLIGYTNSAPVLHGIYQVEYNDATSFYIAQTTTANGTTGGYTPISDSVVSENEVKPNRVYYSKYQQPESVPMVNYFDVGAEGKQIIRIFPLRDSLFVFKEDGLYRISGESIPFSLTLFDSSLTLFAPDSLAVLDNLIYCWTDRGIQAVSESGVQIVSRAIDNIILKLSSSNYTNFKSVTWAVGYKSDNSVTMWTLIDKGDTHARIGYRFNTLTGSWTTINKETTCGIINEIDDKMYLGCGDISYIEKERKNFDRTDYAGREYTLALANGKYNGYVMKFPVISNLAIGDSIVQTQLVSLYEFNMLLAKLDIDTTITDTNYNSLLKIVAGENMRTKLESLALKLDADTGVAGTNYYSSISAKTGTITVISSGTTVTLTAASHGLITGRKVTITASNSTPVIDGDHIVTVIDANTFTIPYTVNIPGTSANYTTVIQDQNDIKTCYNALITLLNNDGGVGYNNYSLVDTTTIQEAIITKINIVTKEVTVNKLMDFIVGDVVAYKSIAAKITYSPNTFGDPLNYKQLRQATVMMDNRALTSATVSFRSDLKPVFTDVEISLDGSGAFGSDVFGEGFFGGSSNAAPIRTLVPRDCMRCRYLMVRFTHNIAREHFAINGITITGNLQQSEKAYR
jgi:hypothetical protein